MSLWDSLWQLPRGLHVFEVWPLGFSVVNRLLCATHREENEWPLHELIQRLTPGTIAAAGGRQGRPKRWKCMR